MDVSKIPFNEFIGISYSDDERYLMMLERGAQYLNHVGTVHAGAMFTLSEASSGAFLLKQLTGFGDTVPVVRKAEVRFRKPASGKLYSSAVFEGIDAAQAGRDLSAKGRILVVVNVTLYDEEGTAVMSSLFEWLISLSK